VIGQTAEADQKKTQLARPTRQWDETSFLAALETHRGGAEVAVVRQILAWAKERSLRLWWGLGRQDGSCFPLVDHQGTTHWLVSLWTYGRVEVSFQMMKTRPPFDSAAKRTELLQRLNTIPGVALPADGIDRRPSFALAQLADAASLQSLLATLDWVVEAIRSS
jgi:hypothetical protein